MNVEERDKFQGEKMEAREKIKTLTNPHLLKQEFILIQANGYLQKQRKFDSCVKLTRIHG